MRPGLAPAETLAAETSRLEPIAGRLTLMLLSFWTAHWLVDRPSAGLLADALQPVHLCYRWSTHGLLVALTTSLTIVLNATLLSRRPAHDTDRVRLAFWHTMVAGRDQRHTRQTV